MTSSSLALVEAVKALADPKRLAILELLQGRGKSRCGPVQAGEAGMCACDVEAAVGLSQAAVSHHMGILRRAGLVHGQKRGRWMFYRREEAALTALARALAGRLERAATTRARAARP